MFKTSAIIRNDDLAAGFRFFRLYGNAKHSGIRIPAVFDGIFNDGLQCQRRHTKTGILYVVINGKAVFIGSLLYSKIGTGMF